jgi:tRNA dimethylallyltransferase
MNGDAMQLYAGLPIITNKITTEEQQGIPHHLLGCISLQEQTWVVGMFVKRALKAIEEIRSRGKLPILVGGTHYYTQSLLFHDRLAEGEGDEEDAYVDDQTLKQQFPILDQPTEVLLQELKKVDPVMAERWHPQDRRKITRSLEIYLRTGRKASDVYAEQNARKQAVMQEDREDDGTPAGTSMRFDTLLLWVHAETEALRARLDKRVDKMLATGLLDEVRTLKRHADEGISTGRAIDETRGIWVSIGYKEFKEYASAFQDGDKAAVVLEKLKAEALEKTKVATRQYAKRQVRWIRIKLINSLHEANAPDRLYLLDGSEIENFWTSVVEPAAELTGSFLQSAPMPSPASLSLVAAEMLQPKSSAVQAGWTKQHCEVCNVTCVIQDQWEQHIRSKAHKKLVSKRRQQTESEQPPTG